MEVDSTPRRIVVTGAYGFVGQYVVAALLKALGTSATIYLCKRDQSQMAQWAAAEAGRPSLESLVFPIEDASVVDQAIRDIRPDALIHLAAIAEPAEATRDSQTAWQINFGGVQHIANALQRHAPKCRFVFASTAEVYGDSFRATGRITEEATLRPTTVYGATKACAEIFLSQRARDGFDAVSVRAFNHTGPGQTPAYVVPAIARQLVRIERGEQEPVLELGNLDGARDFLDVRDVARAYVAATLVSRPSGDAVYNIGSGTPIILRDLIQMMLALTTVPVTIRQDPSKMRKNELPLVSASIEKAQRDLDWVPTIPLNQTLIDIMSYWRSRDDLG